MSDRRADDSGREWRFYLDDMIGFATKVVAYRTQTLITVSAQLDGHDLARLCPVRIRRW